jgi:endonuclease/exonuclease/phosphatase (EEP) superfamily protein YafD
MRVLTWNLFGLSNEHLDVRTEAAMFIALLGGPPEEVFDQRPPPPPDVVLFQEVVDRTFHAHLRPHLSAAGYTIVPSAPRPREYFEVVALRAPFVVVGHEILELDSGQGRELVEVTAERDGQRWLLMTAHLESLRSGSRLRTAQASFVLERLRAHPGPAIFGGDTNLRVEEADRLGVLPDAWEACGEPAAERWTWGGSSGGRRARYDRIWGRGVRFSGIRCIGRGPVTAIGQTPSDHLGLLVTVRSTPPRAEGLTNAAR